MFRRLFDHASFQGPPLCRVVLLLFVLVAVSPAAPPVAAAVCASSFGFAPATLVSASPASIAVGDINKDGRPDLVVGTAGGVGVQLASGSPGNFAAPVVYATGNGSAFVAIGDLNADGRLDLAVANSGSNTVSTLFGSGSPGAFAAPVNYTTGNNPRSVAIGDLNGDGRPDLVVANNCAVSVLLASGAAGSFSPRVDYAALCAPASLAIGDLNGDGRPDLVAAKNGSHRVSVFLASGAPGTFAPEVEYVTGVSPAAVAIGDLNGDGRIDLVAANNVSGTVSIFLASGAAGSFAPGVEYPAGSYPRSVTIGDLNGDGRLDLATTNESTGMVSVLLASGVAGSFAAPLQYTVGSFPQAAAIADLNGDGRLDIAVANYADGTISLLMNSSTPNPGGTFAYKADYAAGAHPSSVAIGDLNGDGWPDLAVGNRYAGTVSVLIANGSAGNFAPKVDYNVGGTPFFLAEGDINNDGRLDIVVTNGAGSNVSVLLASGSPGSFAAKVDYQVGSGPFTVQIADLNQDGWLDLVVANQNTNTISVLLTNGSAGGFAPKVDYSVGSNPRSLAVGDLNGDGWLDLAVANVHGSSIGILFAAGTPGSFAPMVPAASGLDPWSVVMSDLNGDGRLDLVMFDASSFLSVLLASGPPGSFAPKIDYPIGSGNFNLAVGDLNGDGRIDLVLANFMNNSVRVLLASGNPGTFASYVDFQVNTEPVSVAIGDLNVDGRPDLAVANDGADSISVLLNQPAPASIAVSAPAGVTTSSSFAVAATVQDACGNTASGFSGPVALAIKPGTGAAGAALAGTTTVSTVNGVASFSGMGINKRAAGYVLVASAAGTLAGASTTFTVGNAAPVARDDSFSTFEDTPLPASADALANDTDADGDALTGALVSGPSHGTLGVTYAPTADYNGADSLTYRAYDGASFSNVATINITVLPVNDAPSFTKGANQSVAEDVGAQSVSGWASGIGAGPANESGQTLSFLVTNDNNALFAAQPAIAPDGTLSYTPAPDANGSATVTVQAHDNGGTANGGVDTSVAQTFTIAVAPVNDAPTLDQIGDLSVLEDAATQTVNLTGIGIGSPAEVGQTLTVTASSDNPALIPNPLISYSSPSSAATLNFALAANACGAATITVRVSDDGGTANGGMDMVERTFVVLVDPVNDAPDFVVGPNQVVSAASGAQSIVGWASGFTPGPADEASQRLLSYTVVSDSNPALFTVTPRVAADGTLTYAPAQGAGGSATVGLVVRDSGGTANGGVDTSAVKIFTISVGPSYRAYMSLMAR